MGICICHPNTNVVSRLKHEMNFRVHPFQCIHKAHMLDEEHLKVPDVFISHAVQFAHVGQDNRSALVLE
jgi:hypothetical protein